MDIFGDNPQTKILDFLADQPRYDYNISDIAEKSNVSRPTVYKVIKNLLAKKLVIKTRDIGNSPMFKLNTENKLVRIILKFDFEIAKQYADLEDKKAVKSYAPALTGSKSVTT
jgi:DNA-binding transcriptional ArsR family regulator